MGAHVKKPRCEGYNRWDSANYDSYLPHERRQYSEHLALRPVFDCVKLKHQHYPVEHSQDEHGRRNDVQLFHDSDVFSEFPREVLRYYNFVAVPIVKGLTLPTVYSESLASNATA